MSKRDPRIKRLGVAGYNKPKKTPSHPTKSHVVLAKVGDRVKTVRFGQQGATTSGRPKKGESTAKKDARRDFFSRHRKNIARGKLYPAFWAAKVKW